jgi:endo-1,4-beta-D-glucanase Y
MYAYFLDHPTATHDRLMSWYQKKSCGDANGNDSATDGDLDVAFALLLADRQWGSCGAVDYAAEAAAVLADIADGELDASESWPLLGDWVTPGDSTYYPSTRASDLLTDHFRSFAAAAPAGPWSGLLDSVYDVMNAVVAGHAASTGLLPDFIVDPGGSPAPAPEFFLEGTTDGAWAYNACRVPWRLGTDYLVSGDARAKALVDDITDFYRAATGDDPSGIGAGYELDGTPSAGADYLSMAFVAPAGVGAMAEAANQTWLNDVWDVVAGTPLAAEGYYENTLKLLSMLVMAGHWWAPQAVGAPSCAPETTTLCTNPGRLLGAGISLKKLDRGAGEQQMAVTADLFFPIGAERNAEDGLQILVEDAGDGDAAIFELSTRTAAVPGDGEPTCNSRDGWKVKPTKVQYRNRSGAVDAPTCTEGSANGLAKLQYRASAPRDFYLKLKTKRSTIASPVGPVRLTVILGDDAGAGDAACAVSELLECSGDASSLYCE